MHDFEVHFQSGPNCHIYRAQGKSELPTAFLNIPYTEDPEIGAIDRDFRPEFPLFGVVCHPRMAKVPIFTIFWQKS